MRSLKAETDVLERYLTADHDFGELKKNKSTMIYPNVYKLIQVSTAVLAVSASCNM